MTSVKLDLPYRSQWDPDADDHSADCGPTCLAMILNALGDPITPDEVYQVIGERAAAQYTSFSDLLRAGQMRGLTLTRRNFLPARAIDELKANIDAGRPFIALVNYAFWDPYVHNNFRGSHFVLVSGYDETNVFVHDPLFQAERRGLGRFFPWPYRLFVDAWGGFAPRVNPNYAVLISEKTVPHLTGPRDSGGRASERAAVPELDDALRRRLRAKAAYDKQPEPDLNDPAVLDARLGELGNWGESWDTYTVKRGDSLSKIARTFYHDWELWTVIAAFNDLDRPNQIEIGEVYLIPIPEFVPLDDATVPAYESGGPRPRG